MTCAWCDASLGANELLPEYPIGRRLAFDPATARIWAVCPKCDRWNLSFLDEPERRTAIQRLDDFLAATPHRTDAHDLTFGEVGDTHLIRVAATGWRSFAAWRYGRKLHMRYRNWLIFTPFWVTIAIYFNLPEGRKVLEPTPVLVLFIALIALADWRERKRTSFTVPDENRSPWVVRPPELFKVAVQVDGERWSLIVPTHVDHIRLEAFDALHALSRCLPAMNRSGASRATVARAVDLILSQGGPAHFLATILSKAGLGDGTHMLGKLGGVLTVALEIAVNELSEQRALNDELSTARLAHTHATQIAEAIES